MKKFLVGSTILTGVLGAGGFLFPPLWIGAAVTAAPATVGLVGYGTAKASVGGFKMGLGIIGGVAAGAGAVVVSLAKSVGHFAGKHKFLAAGGVIATGLGLYGTHASKQGAQSMQDEAMLRIAHANQRVAQAQQPQPMLPGQFTNSVSADESAMLAERMKAGGNGSNFQAAESTRAAQASASGAPAVANV